MANYRSFIFPDATIEGDRVTLDSRESHHLVRVFRAREGDAVELLDGRGQVRSGVLEQADAKRALVRVKAERTVAAQLPPITLLVAVTKGKAMDLILRMATEIGATVVQPVFTDHSEVRLDAAREQTKLEKWELVLVEACKQCGLPWLPELKAPVRLDDWCPAAPAETLKIVASLEAGSRPLKELLPAASATGGVVLAVGPEGDFSEKEYRLLREAGFLPARLGAQVLRAETAAAYLLSVTDQLLRS